VIRSRTLLFALASVLTLSLLSPATAANPTSTFFLVQTPSFPEYKVTFHGVIKPKVKNAVVRIDVRLNNKWVDTKLRAKSTSSGAWKVQVRATALESKASYRAKVSIGKKVIITKSRSINIKQPPELSAPEQLIALTGPGGRIHGTDVSRWQHPDDKPIDFVKMYNAGIRFVMIKASDTRDDADQLALKYLLMDRNAAQAAGIYTGYYHYTILPNTSDPDAVIRDAEAQAQKAIWRLSSLGGYSEKDLPYALDLENNCISASNGKCTKYAQRSLVTLWAETWLEKMFEKTGRKPIFYSYPTFMEQAMVRSEKLREYPLWKAQYGIDPADPTAEPGRKIFGCFVHSWSTSDCSSLWQIWQYSSCGYGDKYGVGSSRLDLNVFRGTPESFLSLIKGKWQPEPADLMPVNEPTAMNILSVASNTTNDPVEISVEVNRNIGTPVVTGTVVFRPTDSSIKIKSQSAVRAASGRWLLTLTGVPAGSIVGTLNYVDQTKTHAEINLPLTLNLVQGPDLPKPTPTPKPTTTKKPVDSCAKQIRN